MANFISAYQLSNRLRSIWKPGFYFWRYCHTCSNHHVFCLDPGYLHTDRTTSIKPLLPPQFDPASEAGENRVLQLRLEEFVSRRPDIQIETRIKSAEGPGGLLDWLATASAAAPIALPDLVALPRPIP